MVSVTHVLLWKMTINMQHTTEKVIPIAVSTLAIMQSIGRTPSTTSSGVPSGGMPSTRVNSMVTNDKLMLIITYQATQRRLFHCLHRQHDHLEYMQIPLHATHCLHNKQSY